MRVAVAILDSGCSRSHPALREAVLAGFRSFVDEDPLEDRVGHGTECCGTLLARPHHGGPGGVAQDARVFVGQIIRLDGFGTAEALLSALEWAASLGVDIVAIPSGRLEGHVEVDRAIEMLAVAGVLIIAPVGNPFRTQRGPLYPASHPHVAAVGIERCLDDYRTWRRPPDVVMARHDIPVCQINGGWRAAGDASQATMLTCGFACAVTTWRSESEGGSPRERLPAAIRALHNRTMGSHKEPWGNYKKGIGDGEIEPWENG